MKAILVGPDPDEAVRWSADVLPVHYFSRFDELPAGFMGDAELVVVDLQAVRVGTGEPDADLSLIDTLTSAATDNPDANWVVIAPAGATRAALAAQDRLLKVLSGGIRQVRLLVESHTMADARNAVQPWLNELTVLAALPLDVSKCPGLGEREHRCISRLLRDVDTAELTSVDEGHSEARVVMAKCRVRGAETPLRVVKVGPREEVAKEHANFMQFVRHQLGQNRHPQHDTADIWHAGNKTAIVYTFAGGTDAEPLSQAIRARDVTDAVTDLFEVVLRPWLSMQAGDRMPLGVFISRFLGISTADASRLWRDTPNPPFDLWDPTDWLTKISNLANDADVPECVAHGDLHGYNVFVTPTNQTWLIDFGRTGMWPGLFDHAFMDSALLLHKSADAGGCAMPCTANEIRDSEERYEQGGVPFRSELSEIRAQAQNQWGNEREALFFLARAVAALRWLRYPTTDHARAKVLASRAASRAQHLRPEWELAPAVPDIPF